MKDPATIPILRAEFTLPDGEVLVREWTMMQAASDPYAMKLKGAPFSWLDNPRRAWDHPQDPVTFKGNVKSGHEDEARQFIEGGTG